MYVCNYLGILFPTLPQKNGHVIVSYDSILFTFNRSLRKLELVLI